MILKGFAWLENDVPAYNLSVFKHRVYLYTATDSFNFDLEFDCWIYSRPNCAVDTAKLKAHMTFFLVQSMLVWIVSRAGCFLPSGTKAWSLYLLALVHIHGAWY
jgi:hypothetical protein